MRQPRTRSSRSAQTPTRSARSNRLEGAPGGSSFRLAATRRAALAAVLRGLLGLLGLLSCLPGPLLAQPDAGADPTMDASNRPDRPDDAGAEAAPSGSYGYIRTLEGSASVTQPGGSREAAEINQPVMVGDRITLPAHSHLEIVLADHNIVRLDGGSDLVLDALAASSDRNDPATVLRLLEGNLQLVVVQDSLGEELPSVELPNASVYSETWGAFRLTADGGDWSEVVARRGAVQVASEGGNVDVHAGEELVVDASGAHSGSAVRLAGNLDSLERWGRQLDDEARGAVASADMRSIDPGLRYQSAALDRYGTWVNVDGTSYWRPVVAEDWSPYLDGRWDYTPSGITWVSNEPWGWVPYHYGTWDYLPSFGWAWRPGFVFAPAWVYWYWGPSHVGWCPVGYYTSFYGRHFPGFSFAFGVYGWAGGSFGAFGGWNFVAAAHLGNHFIHRVAIPAARLRDQGVFRELPRGIITTDTRRITPAAWHNPGRAMRILSSPGRQLADVTPFIARERNLPPAVLQAVRADPARANRLAGTPLRPGTLGTRSAEVHRPPLPATARFAERPAGADRSGRPAATGRTAPSFSAAPRTMRATPSSGLPGRPPQEHRFPRQTRQTPAGGRQTPPQVRPFSGGATEPRGMAGPRPADPQGRTESRRDPAEGSSASPHRFPRDGSAGLFERPRGEGERPPQQQPRHFFEPARPAPAQQRPQPGRGSEPPHAAPSQPPHQPQHQERPSNPPPPHQDHRPPGFARLARSGWPETPAAPAARPRGGAWGGGAARHQPPRASAPSRGGRGGDGGGHTAGGGQRHHSNRQRG